VDGIPYLVLVTTQKSVNGTHKIICKNKQFWMLVVRKNMLLAGLEDF
jgi:hypothetical protein